MGTVLLRLRWSWRDLRARWLQVAAIALVIGIGTGVYSGLSSMAAWRQESFDASYEQLAMWDLHMELAEGTGVPAEELLEVVTGMPSAAEVSAAEARLVVPTQVDASTGDDTILVPGRIVGVDVSDGGPQVARLHAVEGRTLGPGDRGADVAMLDEHFADYHGLAEQGTLRVTGGTELEYVGRGLSPEYLVIIPPQGTVYGEAGFAVSWAPLDTVQRISGRPGEANSLVLTVAPGADRRAVEADLVDALAAAFPDLGATIAHREDDPGLRTLYDDIEGDQQINRILALLILSGAAFAAFNLTGRIIESQRRELGIGMALGTPRLQLAARPLLVGVQVALLGVAFGVGVGYLMLSALRSLLSSFFPLPVWITGFQPEAFARGAALGLVIPVVATLGPVIRSVRVPPVEAISTTHRASSGGLAPLLRRVRLPGSSLAQLPVRNTLRAPRRTVLTALGIGAAIATMVGVLGLMDSVLGTIDRGRTEILGDSPDRLAIDLDPALVESPEVQAVLGSPALDGAEPAISLGGLLDPEGEAVEVFLSVTDLDSDLWHPTFVEGTGQSSEPGIVLSRKAAEDLALDVGDPVVLRHPVREGLGFRLDDSELPVIGVQPNPYRFTAYVDIAHAGLFAMDGITNTVFAEPAAGTDVQDAQRALFGQEGVVSAQPVSVQADAIEDAIEEFLGIFTVLQVAVLVLALLIAFNSSSINVDERRRENATMFAYGVRVRSVLRSNVVESVITGLLGIAVGLALGRLLVSWVTRGVMADTLPDIGITPMVSLSTVSTTLVLGLAAVALAPVLTVRKLSRMDIPSTLRVME